MVHAHADLVWRDEAVQRALDLREAVYSSLETEAVELDSIADRVVAESIVADRDVPGHDFATMDGYAFDATTAYPLDIKSDEVYPEDEPPSVEPSEAVQIATGAPLPESANAVLKREDATIRDGELRGPDVEPGTYVYERGSNSSAGEILFEPGERLTPKDAILLGDLGKRHVDVVERLSVGILATGTEIHEGKTRDLDTDMLAGLVRSWGHDATCEGTVPDEYERVASAIDRVATEYDVVVTTGGTSVGHKDHVVRALSDLGSVRFHRVRLRPGKPIALARLSDQDAVACAVPGKPIGAHTAASLVMRPFFTGTRLTPSVTATIQRDVSLGSEGFEYAIPVTITENDDAREAMPLGHSDSPLQIYNERFDPSVLSSSTRASRADGIVLARNSLEAGSRVEVLHAR